MNWMRSLHAVALLGAVFCTFAYAQTRSFIIGVEDLDYYPAYTVANGQYGGFARELFDTFGKDAGIRFEYRPFPVPRLYANFFADRVDFKFPDNAKWQGDLRRGKNIIHSDPVMAYIDGTLVPAAMLGKGEARVKTLGTVTGFTPWNWKRQIDARQVTVTENANFAALAQQTINGRVDAAYGSVAVMNYQVESILKSKGALVFDPALPHSRDSYYLATLKHPAVVTEFNAWMKANAAKVNVIKQKYAVEKGVTAP
jgi:polar amino acid transport system substrate-binding protein